MFTLRHHIIVVITIMRTNSQMDNYAILGDDIVIKSASVAKEYLRIMKSVEINLEKTHVPRDSLLKLKIKNSTSL